MVQTISIIVDGLVQGVFYRQSTKVRAIESGIKGEVKNKPDGTVQIIATGTGEQLDELVKWCNTGPELAIVTNVKVEKIPLQSFKSFDIVRSSD